MTTRRRRGRRRNVRGDTGTMTENEGGGIDHGVAHATESEDIDTEIAHGRATGGETMVAMTDADIDREAATISEGKIIQSASANPKSM